VTTTIVLLALAVGWGIFLSLWWRDSRQRTSRYDTSMSGFNSGISPSDVTAFFSSLGGPRDLTPRSSFAAQRRRQQVMIALASAAVISLLAYTRIGVIGLVAHVLFVAGLIAYSYAVVQRRNLAAEREIKVQMLHPRGVAPVQRERVTVNA